MLITALLVAAALFAALALFVRSLSDRFAWGERPDRPVLFQPPRK